MLPNLIYFLPKFTFANWLFIPIFVIASGSKSERNSRFGGRNSASDFLSVCRWSCCKNCRQKLFIFTETSLVTNKFSISGFVKPLSRPLNFEVQNFDFNLKVCSQIVEENVFRHERPTVLHSKSNVCDFFNRSRSEKTEFGLRTLI